MPTLTLMLMLTMTMTLPLPLTLMPMVAIPDGDIGTASSICSKKKAMEERAEATSGDARAAVKAKYAWTDELSADDVDWLAALPYTITFPHYNAIVVHAGLLPDIPLVRLLLARSYTLYHH